MPRKQKPTRQQRETLAHLLAQETSISTEEKMDWVRSLSGESATRKSKPKRIPDWLQSSYDAENQQKLKREEIFSRRRFSLVIGVALFITLLSLIITWYSFGMS